MVRDETFRQKMSSEELEHLQKADEGGASD